MHLNITLAVADLEITTQFYRDVLQLPVKKIADSHGEECYLLVTMDNIQVVFHHREVMEAFHPAVFQNLTRDSFGVGLQLELNCPDLKNVYRQITRQRWPISYELEDQEHQRRELWLHDPDGYLLILNEESN